MRVRAVFVSNSSSCSFILVAEDPVSFRVRVGRRVHDLMKIGWSARTWDELMVAFGAYNGYELDGLQPEDLTQEDLDDFGDGFRRAREAIEAGWTVVMISVPKGERLCDALIGLQHGEAGFYILSVSER